MSVPTVVLNENTPAGDDYKRDGDNRIREYKTQNRQVMGVDHKYDSSGQDADMGCHNKVSLLEQNDLGSGAVGKTLLGSQTISGKGELVYTDEDDNDVQITSGGALLGTTVTSIVAVIYPVGSLYMSTNSTDPATVLGLGTWAIYGAGKVLISLDSGDADFDTSGETGGSKTVDLTHDHDGHTGPGVTGGSGGTVLVNTLLTEHRHVINSDLSAAQTIVQPYIVVYMWKRTA